MIVSVSSDNIRRTTDSLNQAAKKPLCSSLDFRSGFFQSAAKAVKHNVPLRFAMRYSIGRHRIPRLFEENYRQKPERRDRSAPVATLGGLLAAMSQASGELQSSPFNGFPDQLEPVWSDA